MKKYYLYHRDDLIDEVWAESPRDAARIGMIRHGVSLKPKEARQPDYSKIHEIAMEERHVDHL